MISKVVYFIRHGETELNARGIRQGPDGPLSPKGREQVAVAAHKFPKGKGRPQVLISSPYQRARETAEIIAHELNMPIEYSDLLRERRNPKEIVGHEKDEWGVRKIVDRIDMSYHPDDLRYSNEENFVDLRNRAKALLDYILSREERQIIMITHGIFLKMVVCYMLLGDKLTAAEYVKLSYLNSMDNAALTVCEYVRPWYSKSGKWNLVMWNNQLAAPADSDA